MIRVSVFRLDSKVAASKVGLAHEALGSMFSGCLHYQVDLIGGDANKALCRVAGRNRESMDIRGGMYQNTPRLLPGGLDGDPKVLSNVPPSRTPQFVKKPLSSQAI